MQYALWNDLCVKLGESIERGAWSDAWSSGSPEPDIQLLLARVASARRSSPAQHQDPHGSGDGIVPAGSAVFHDRPSLDPPEQLLKAQLLMALYLVRSDRLFCQMLDYNILFRWILDMSLSNAGLDQSNFSRLRERLVSEDLAQRFFDAIVKDCP